MTEIKLLPEDEFSAFIAIVANAYPGLKLDTQEVRDQWRDDLLKLNAYDAVNHYGAYRAGKLVGGMIYYDFKLQLLSVRTLSGGVGMIAVDLLHKKEKIAKDIVSHFVTHYAGRGIPMLMLYPFRPDFYKQMGFGYGSLRHEYRFKPLALRRGPSKAHLRFLGPDDREAVRACYNRYVDKTNGMIEMNDWEVERQFSRPTVLGVGYEDGGALQGYMVFTFKEVGTTDPYKNNIIVHRLIAHHREALSEMLTFLHTQFDQIEAILYYTEDDAFHHLLLDPRNGSEVYLPPVFHTTRVSGLRLMYRVIDVPRLFAVLAGHDFGGQTCTLRITLADSFYPPNAGSTVVRFTEGRAAVAPDGQAEVEIRLDVAEFSSLVMGVVSFRRLYGYGLADISDPAYLSTVDRLFAAEKPVCMTGF